MKKILFSLLLSICVSYAYAQFTLTQKGLVSSEYPSKDYVVYSFDGKSQSEIYRKVLLFVNATYNSPKDVLNEVPEEMISIKGTQPNAIQRTKTAFYDLHYNLTIRLKDGKIRIDQPTFECNRIGELGPVIITLTEKRSSKQPVLLRIFNPKNGKVEMDKVKSQIESFFNKLCKQIESSIDNQADSEW